MTAFTVVLRGGGGPQTLTPVGFATPSDDTFTMPASIQSGDLAIVGQYIIGDTDGDISFGAMSGWTEIVTSPAAGVSARTAVWRKILLGSETTINTGSSGGEINTFCLVLRPSRSITSIDHGTWNAQGTTGNPSPQSVDPTALPAPVVTIGIAGAQSGSFSFATFSPSADGSSTRDSGSAYARFSYRIDNVTPAATSIDMADEGTRNVLVSGYVAVS